MNKQTKICMAALSLAVVGAIGVCAEDYFTYWTQLQAVNLTPYDIQITKVNFSHHNKDVPSVKAGDIIPKADVNNPEQEPTMIGEVRAWSRGVDIELWFKLLGNEGSEDCYMKLHNPYTGNNYVHPGETFPTSQCPSAAPADIPDSKPAPLYHNIEMPSAGHKLSLVALFAFQKLIPDDAGMSAQEQQQAVQDSRDQMNQADQDRNRFRQDTGIWIP